MENSTGTHRNDENEKYKNGHAGNCVAWWTYLWTPLSSSTKKDDKSTPSGYQCNSPLCRVRTHAWENTLDFLEIIGCMKFCRHFYCTGFCSAESIESSTSLESKLLEPIRTFQRYPLKGIVRACVGVFLSTVMIFYSCWWKFQFMKVFSRFYSGTGESGKSTLTKQMKIIHIDGYNDRYTFVASLFLFEDESLWKYICRIFPFRMLTVRTQFYFR